MTSHKFKKSKFFILKHRWCIGAAGLCLLVFFDSVFNPGIVFQFLWVALLVCLSGLIEFESINAAKIKFSTKDLLDRGFNGAFYAVPLILILGLLLISQSQFKIGVLVVLYSAYEAALNFWRFNTQREIESLREKIDRKCDIYLGKELDEQGKSKPIFLPDNKLRCEHTGIFGGSGKGKTKSLITPMALHDIETNKHVVIVDPKRDLDFLEMVYSKSREHGRKFVFVDFSAPELSDPYNPLSFGDESVVKDKIISSCDWSEQFYKTVAQDAVLEACIKTFDLHNKRGRKDERITLMDVYKVLNGTKNTEGIVSFLKALLYTSRGNILSEDSKRGADSYYDENAVVYFHVPVETSPELATQIGRLILGDYRALSGRIKSIPDDEKKDMSLYIDEADKFVDINFKNFLTLARSSNMRLILATQGLSNFSSINPELVDTILVNTEIKFYMYNSSGKEADTISKSIGTHDVEVVTEQTDNEEFDQKTGRGSIRQGKEFKVHTDVIKTLGKGETIFVSNSNKNVKKLYLDNMYFRSPIIYKIQDERWSDAAVAERKIKMMTYARDRKNEVLGRDSSKEVTTQEARI